MGLIKAISGAVGGSLGDQWKDFYGISSALAPTVAISTAQKHGRDGARGSNTDSSEAIISNGSRIIVPEGYGLVTVQDGGFTSFVTEPGGYVWDTNDQDSKSIFAGNGFWNPLLKTSWERFKLGGRPGSEQQAFFVSLQELGNNKFSSASEIYWDDKFLGTQAGANVRGVYSLRIVDPLVFLKTFVPPVYLKNGRNFDLTDLDNPSAQQLFNEVVGSLSAAFAQYANDPSRDNRISNIQRDSMGFASALSDVVQRDFSWEAARGITIVNTSIVAIEYDESTKSVLQTVQRADSLMGQRGNSNLQASVAAGLESAGSTEGATGILGMGFAAGTLGLGSMQQPEESSGQDDSYTKLASLKKMLDEELISQDEYDAAKAKILGL